MCSFCCCDFLVLVRAALKLCDILCSVTELTNQNEGTEGADASVHVIHVIQDGYYYTPEEAGHESHDHFNYRL